MNITTTRCSKHLAFDNLVIDPQLARRLPSAVAFRYHALPLAEDRHGITIAMANPEDKAAIETITQVLGKELYIVKSETSAIDSLLAEVWPGETFRSYRLLAYRQASPIADRLQVYAERLGELLGSRPDDFQDATGEDASFDDLLNAAHGYDLVIFGEPRPNLVERLFAGRTDLKAARLLPASVLIVRQPRWPLRRILVVTRGHTIDDVAVDWTTRLAQATNADVVVLAVMPGSASGWNHRTHTACGLADWLASETPLGQQLRLISQRLIDTETQSTLRFRQGPPERQIQCEVVEGDYDLIIVAADPSHWCLRRALGEIVTTLLDVTDTPVLVAKPRTDCRASS
ncbi:MAG: hypothetical protein Kow0063_30910 [Anaerolineae bacterium]